MAKLVLDLEAYDGSPSHKLQILVKSLKPTLRCLLKASPLINIFVWTLRFSLKLGSKPAKSQVHLHT